MLFEASVSPLVYGLLLAAGVGVGLPMGPAVVGAGALYGGVIGLGVVLIAQCAGLAINWHVCRHWCRSWILQRVDRRQKWRWVVQACQRELSFRSLLLLRLALLPTALVSACCALSATNGRCYSLASLILVLRFLVMVQVGAAGAAALEGKLSAAAAATSITAAAATAALAWFSAMKLKRRFYAGSRAA